MKSCDRHILYSSFLFSLQLLTSFIDLNRRQRVQFVLSYFVSCQMFQMLGHTLPKSS